MDTKKRWIEFLSFYFRQNLFQKNSIHLFFVSTYSIYASINEKLKYLFRKANKIYAKKGREVNGLVQALDIGLISRGVTKSFMRAL